MSECPVLLVRDNWQCHCHDCYGHSSVARKFLMDTLADNPPAIGDVTVEAGEVLVVTGDRTLLTGDQRLLTDEQIVIDR